MYIYVGKLTCSGKLDNGKAWEGLRLAAGVCDSKTDQPFAVKVYKCSNANNKEVFCTLECMEPGEYFNMSFDEMGRVVHVETI